MKITKESKKKFLLGLALSLVLAMAVGSFSISETQTPVTPQAETQSLAETNADTGNFVVSGGSYGTSNDYDFDTTGRVLYIHPQDAETKITISTGSSTTDRIEVTSAATIILAGVEIDRSSITATEEPGALTITDNAAFNVNISLEDGTENILKGAAGDASAYPAIYGYGSPGIQKNGDTSVGILTITGSTGENAGKLEATGGYGAAGIGSKYQFKASNITINGGYVKATGGDGAAGIGGGLSGIGSYIWITGGTVTATGGDGAAGIGGGCEENGSYIWITGGKVKATALLLGEDEDDGSGAGIGGGYGGNGIYITISGGEVTSTASTFGAGIGGGLGGNGTDITISGGVVTATGGDGGAGIGGGGQANGEKIEITGGVIKATGGLYMTYPAAGIGGGGMGSASDNKLDGDAVVMAASGGENKDALEGFENNLTKGITVTGVVTDYTTDPYTIDWKIGMLYGNSVTITEDTTFPVDFTITSTAALTVGKNSEDKEATLSMAEGKKLTVEGSLTNEGVIDIPAENLTCNGNGKITTLLNYDPQGGDIKTNDDSYITYQNASGVQTYKTMPEVEKDGYYFGGWYSEKGGEGTKVDATSNVILNAHVLYANWTTEPGPDPTPTPPGPEPGPTPEPTPDPLVDPDGDGSGSSSKTSDPFMGGIALALLGVATTGAVLVRKRK